MMHSQSNFQFYGFLSSQATMWAQKRSQHKVLSVGDAGKMEKRSCDKEKCETDYGSYADDNTLYVSGDSIDDVIMIKSPEDDRDFHFYFSFHNLVTVFSSRCVTVVLLITK